MRPSSQNATVFLTVSKYRVCDGHAPEYARPRARAGYRKQVVYPSRSDARDAYSSRGDEQRPPRIGKPHDIMCGGFHFHVDVPRERDAFPTTCSEEESSVTSVLHRTGSGYLCKLIDIKCRFYNDFSYFFREIRYIHNRNNFQQYFYILQKSFYNIYICILFLLKFSA